MNQQTDARRAYVVALLDRLRRQYADRALLPSKDDNTDDLIAAGVMDGETLSLQLLQRLYRAIPSEGYGL
jgi:hypothetical protein